MQLLRLLATTCAVLVLAATALGFNGHVVTTGPLTVTIVEIPVVKLTAATLPCTVTLANAGAIPLPVTVELHGLIDDCRAVGATQQRVTVPAQGTATATFQFTCGPGTYSAHYPVRVRATFAAEGGAQIAHAVRIFETDFGPAAAAGGEPPPVRVPASGAFALTSVKTQRMAWRMLANPSLTCRWAGPAAIPRR